MNELPHVRANNSMAAKWSERGDCFSMRGKVTVLSTKRCHYICIEKLKVMKKFVSLLVCVMVLVACGQVASPVKPEAVIVHRDLDSEVIKTVAKMSVGGMMCADGCGGKIQQDLRALPGVIGTELDFTEGSPENIVKVEYDPAVTDEKKLIECVHGIADGKYSVSKVEVLHYHGLHNKASNGGAAV
jgi:copper chaperone CopZ